MPKPVEKDTDESEVEEVEQPAEVDEETPETDIDQDESDQDGSKLRKVRREAQTLRERAKAAESRADELAQALFTARVQANGKLASPDDLPFNAALLDDADALDAAIDDVITKNPHYAKRRIVGDVGQGQKPISAPQDFSALLRG